jgi:hypothetical protein
MKRAFLQAVYRTLTRMTCDRYKTAITMLRNTWICDQGIHMLAQLNLSGQQGCGQHFHFLRLKTRTAT